MKRTLLLVPTQYELSMIDPQILRSWENSDPEIVDQNLIAVCGFGMAVSGARTAHLLATLRPDQVILMGIAGRFGSTLEIGKAYPFSEVACYGIGAGAGQNHRSASELGWKHWDGDDLSERAVNESAVSANAVGLRIPIMDQIHLNQYDLHREPHLKLKLLTATAASNDEDDVADKLKKYSDVVAEDMEGFSVAAACQLASVPLTIIRGISNQAGDRDHKNWQVHEAMTSVALIVEGILATGKVA
jgi:futalosine hydrolase